MKETAEAMSELVQLWETAKTNMDYVIDKMSQCADLLDKVDGRCDFERDALNAAARECAANLNEFGASVHGSLRKLRFKLDRQSVMEAYDKIHKG